MQQKLTDIVKTVASWLPVIGLLMLFTAMPYGWSWYQQICCWTLGLGYLLYVVVYQKWRDIRWDRSKWVYVIMLALFAMLPIRQLFDPHPPTAYYLWQVQCHVWFLYLGLAGILGFSDKLKLKYIAYVMLLTSAVMLAHCLFLYWCTKEGVGLSPLYRFDDLRWKHIHSHMVMNLYMNVAIIMGLYVLPSERQWWRKILVGAGILCAFALIWLSIGRVGQITSALVIMAYLVYRLYPVNKWLTVGSVAACIVLACITISQFSQDKFKPLNDDPREAIWDYSFRMVQEKPIVGYGLSTLSEKYVEEAYQDSTMLHGFIEPVIYTYPHFAAQGKTMQTHHPHNAFLMYWLAIGIGGLLLLIGLFVTACMVPMGKDKFYFGLILAVIFIQCLTEPVGGHLLPQFIAFIIFVWEKTHPIELYRKA